MTRLRVIAFRAAPTSAIFTDATVELSSWNDGADDRIRTGDLLITNQLLYQLSYVGIRKTFLRSPGAATGSAAGPEPQGEPK